MADALARNRHIVDAIHTTLSLPASPSPRRDRSKPGGGAQPASPSPPPSAPPRSPTQWPPSDAFILRLRLSQLAFPGGPAALPALFLRAPGGAFGKVIIGTIARTGTPSAVKVLLGRGGREDDREAFLREAENLLRLRNAADAVRLLEERGHPLELADEGAGHVAYAYGTGEEPDLSALDPALPPGPAFLIAVEPLAETLTERLRRAPGGLLPLQEALRAAHEIALGLAFRAKHGVVVSTETRVALGFRQVRILPPSHFQHSDLKPDNIMFRGSSGDAVLCDLGVGRLTGGGAASTAYDGHGGTLLYLAPELLDNKGRSATAATDMCVEQGVCVRAAGPHAPPVPAAATPSRCCSGVC